MNQLPDNIPQDTAREYRAVAALAVDAIELLNEVATVDTLTADDLRRHIGRTLAKVRQITTDAASRDEQYATFCRLWGMVLATRQQGT